MHILKIRFLGLIFPRKYKNALKIILKLKKSTGTAAKCPARQPEIHFSYPAQCISGAVQHFQVSYLLNISLALSVISSRLLLPQCL